jgi:transcriptional regulator of acetoin/glycerol metabolism
MTKFSGNKKRAAEELGVDRSVFYEKMKKYEIT